MTLDMKTRAMKKVNECKALALKMGIDVGDVEVMFDLTGPSMMGQAGIKRGQKFMRFHPDMIALHGDVYINDTIPHEFAHIMMFATGAHMLDTPHGKTWKGYARAVGAVNPKSTTNLALPAAALSRKRSTATHLYECGCRKHNLTTIRHNKVRSGKANYKCKYCGEILKPF